MEDCILSAVKNNLGVAVEILNSERAGLSVSGAGEKFIPSLSFSFNRQETNSGSYSWIEAAEKVTTSYDYYYARVSQLIPTGGGFSVSLANYTNDTNRKFQTINPVYSSTLRFRFDQPLLKDFGFRTSRKEIIIAQNNREKSEDDLKSTLLQTIYDVEEAYWNLVYSIETLKVKRQSLELARDLLKKNQKEVEIGTMAPKEILSSQAEVAAREAEILQYETLVKNSVDRLKTIINLPDEEGITEIIPVDKPAFEMREVNLEEAFRRAVENRPDLQAFRISLKNNEIELGYARNQLLPSLDLSAEYWSPGISGDQIVYENGDVLRGVIIDRIPGKVSDSLKDAFDLKYKNWSVYLTLDIPLSTVFSRAAVAQARVNLEQAELRLKKQEQQASLEIKTAVRAVQTDYKRVQANRIARELAEKKLEAEEAKLKAGMTTNFILLSYQRDLANARTAELKAIIDYNLSLSQLDKAMGITLESKNIRFADVLSR